MSKRMFKVRGELDGQVKVMELPMDATYAMIREKFGDKFGCTVTGITVKRPDGSCVPITSESQYQQIFREICAVATCLNIEIKTPICYQSPKRHDAPSASSPRTPTKLQTPKATPTKPAGNEVACNKCGMKLPAGSRFCAGCGNSLEPTTPTKSSATTPAATPTKSPAAAAAAAPTTPKTPASPTAAAPASPTAAEGPVSDDPNMCPACGKPAVGRTLKALGRSWHIACFKCTSCGKQIVGSFNAEQGKPYCAACYEDKFAERCARCGKPLMGAYVFANDRPYHKECFVCSKCGKPITTGYHVKNGEPICNECV